MIWDALRGHREQIEMFRRSLRRGRWSQAYLLVGPEGVGKRRFAGLLAQCLFCRSVPDEDLNACGRCPDCRMMEAGTHPDFLPVERPEGKNALPIKLFVGEDESRGKEGLCHDITLRPMAATRRIAVVDDAHLMTPESANSLLKTLEEPPPYATLILVASDTNVLLPTIRSRCQQVRFSPLPAEDVAAILTERGIVADLKEAHLVATLSEGSLTTAEQLAHPQLRELRELLYEHLARPASGFDAVALSRQILDGLEKLGGETAVQRQNASWLLRFTAEFCRSALREMAGVRGGGAADIAAGFAARRQEPPVARAELLMDLLDRLAETEGDLQRNMPVPLCLEALFGSFGRRLRPRPAG